MTDNRDHTGASDDHEIEPDATNRRNLLKAAVLGGAGAAVGALAMSQHASAAPEPGALELGAAATNTSTTPTTLIHDPPAPRATGPSSLSVAGAAIPADFPEPAQVGGYGTADVRNGVHGSTANGAGHGVVAATLAAAPAATAAANMPALELIATAASHVHFIAGSVSGPTAGVHLPGELYLDKDYTLWFSLPPAAVTTPASPVRWVKLAGTGAATASPYQPINPSRAYDSRVAAYAPLVTGVLAPNQSREIPVSDAHNTAGALTTKDVVPPNATAALVNITVSSPTGKNFISVTAGNVTTTATSLQNWDGDVTQIANSVVVPLSPTRTIRVYMGDQAGSANFIVDVFGYYL